MNSHNNMKETDMDYEKTISNMQKYGGSFVRQLGALWLIADPENRAKIASAFGDVFDRYESIGDVA